jgi:uncharacterized membrane protein
MAGKGRQMQSAEHRNAAVFAGSEERTETRSSHTLEIWQFINILLSALMTGVFWGSWLGLSRSIASFTPETFLAIGHAMIGNLAPVMPLLMPAAMLATLPVLYLLYRRRSKAIYPTLAGLALFVVALLITLIVEVPIDNQIKEWTVTSLPANWQQLRDRWEFFHMIRTWASVAGLALLLAGALFMRDNVDVRRPSVEPDAPREQPPERRREIYGASRNHQIHQNVRRRD